MKAGSRMGKRWRRERGTTEDDGGAGVAGGGGRCPCASCHGVVVVAGLRRGRRCRAELVQQRGLCFPPIERRW